MFSNWNTQVCNVLPYDLFTPFAFSFKTTSGDYYSTEDAYCGWGKGNTAFRISLACCTILGIPPLFVKTFYSNFAPVIFFMATFLWIIIFVLDANSYTLGYKICASNFKNTNMGLLFATAINSQTGATDEIVPDCSPTMKYVGSILIDISMSFLSLLIFLAWGKCKDLYNQGNSSESVKETKSPITNA